MPYIDPARREAIFGDSTTDYNTRLETPGELNFFITDTIVDYLQHKGLSYQTINDIIGALEGVKLEFYSRVVVKYEKKKRKQNGDVY